MFPPLLIAASDDTKALRTPSPPRSHLQSPLTLYPESGPRDTQACYHFSPWSTHRHKQHLRSAPSLWAHLWSPRTLVVRKGEHSINYLQTEDHQQPSWLLKSLYTLFLTHTSVVHRQDVKATITQHLDNKGGLSILIRRCTQKRWYNLFNTSIILIVMVSQAGNR